MSFTTEALLENLCRTCMVDGNENKIVSIFDGTGRLGNKSITIMELLLLTIPKLRIETNDMLPKVLCENCLEKLINVHEFQKMCIRVEEKLRQVFDERIALKSQIITDPLNDNRSVNQAINDLTNILKVEMDEQIAENEISLVDNDEEKDVKFETENNQWDSGSSDQFEDDISTDKDSDWEFGTGYIPKTKKMSKTAEKKVRELSCNSPNSAEQNSEEICDKALKEGKERKKKKHRPDSNDDDESKNFVCDECGSCLKTQRILKRHKKMHMKPSGDQKMNPTKTKYECEFCKKVFQQSSSLKDHLRIHTGEQPYLCSECGKAFKSLSNMKQHFLRHGTDRPYACPDCPKRFPCLSDLASHKVVHNKKKSHVCDICNAGFAKPYLLKKHKMYHTGEKNHKCDYCEMRFVLADQCRRHMRTHTGEKPYKCKYCERAFAQSNDLIKHLRGHLGDNVYKCDLCPQGFRLQGDLRAHFYTHKNDDEETRARNLQALKDEEQRIQMKFGLVKCQ